jgi:hypothetical protein
VITFGSTGDGMLPVSCQEHAVSVYLKKTKQAKTDIYNERKATHGFKKSISSENAH